MDRQAAPSQPQVDLLKKYEVWKGVKIDWSKPMTAGQVSDLIDELKGMPSVQNKSPKVKEMIQSQPLKAPPLSYEEREARKEALIRKAQAFNRVWDFHAQSGEWPIKNEDGFCDQVRQVEELIKRCQE